MAQNKSIFNETKSEQLYRLLKDGILNGEFPPGEKLVISKLASHFSTSTIPVREALSRLETKNLVTIVPHTGAYVKKLNIDILKETYPIRCVLECYALRLAIKHLTPNDLMILKTLIEKINHAIDAQDHDQIGQVNIEFHRKIYTASKNSTLVSLIDDLCEKTFFARLVFKFNPERAKVSNEEHVMIVEALEKQDLENAEKLIIQQSEKTLNLLKDL